MSNNKIKEICVLMQECIEHLQHLGYSDACITQHQKKWAEYLLPYLQKEGITSYTSDIGEKYLESILSSLPLHPKRVLTRSIHILSVYLETGEIPKRIVHLVEHPLLGEIGEIAVLFLEKQISKRRSELTVTKHRMNLSYFTIFLESKSKSKIADIEEEDIISFLSTSRNAKDRYYTMRRFLRFLYEQNYIKTDFEYVLARNRFPRREKLPSIYSAEEIRRIESSIEQSGPIGKRDYAILLLASRLGLRASDICRLKFSNMDWDHNIIGFTQYKTGKPIELPLLAEVGEAVVNYLRYARPISDCQEIFLSARPPYCPMNRSSINSAISKIIRESGVDISDRNFGPHAMRHSLASHLLAKGVSLPVISETLGHSNTLSTMEYLRVDVSSLIKCTLDVPLVTQEFYEQKGGVFYG
jgi:integrase/recombinase